MLCSALALFEFTTRIFTADIVFNSAFDTPKIVLSFACHTPRIMIMLATIAALQ